MNPDPTEELVAAALQAAAPGDTEVERGLADLHARLQGTAGVPRPVGRVHRSRRAFALAGVAALVLIVGGAIAADRNGEEDVSSDLSTDVSSRGSVEVEVVPSQVAVDERGTPWGVEVSPSELRVVAFFDGAQVDAVPVDRGSSSGIGGVVFAAWGEGVALGHVVCDDDLCDEGTLAVEVFTMDGSEIAARRMWESDPVSAPGAPTLLSAGDDSISIAVGAQVITFGPGRSAETVQMTGQEGDPCIVEGTAVAVAPTEVVDEFEGPFGSADDDGIESVHVVRLGSTSARLAGSEISYDRAGGERIRCSGGRLEVARGADQLALATWTVSTSWQSRPAAELGWGPGEVTSVPEGLVGLLDGNLVLVDSANGNVVAAVAVPPDVIDQRLSGPSVAAIGATAEVAIICVSSRSQDDHPAGTCHVL